MKHRFLYHIIQKQKELKVMISKTFTETFINLKSLINNDLKRKQKCSINESHLFNMIIIFKNTILNHLVKKSKTNKLKSILITSILVSFSFEDFIRKVSTLQTFKRTLNSFKCKFKYFSKRSFKYYSTTFTSSKKR